ncbi:25579_t:CDS:2, partial [Gigaspora margarita]
MELSSPVCDIKFSDLEIVFENILIGGFGEVYKGKLRGHIIAAKYVKRETPTNLKDFNRELKALRLSEKCKSNIIKFFGLSHGLREKREKGMPMQYIDIYEKCWSPDPSLRPEISEILYRLVGISLNLCLLQNQDNYDEFLTLENYNSFCKFLKNLEEIKNFIVDISQIRKLIFFIHETDCGISLERLKDKYVKLLEKFHESASSLQFNIRFIQTYRRNFGSGSLFQLIEKTSKDIQNTANNKLLEDVDIQEPYNNENVITKEFEPDDKKMFWIRVAVLKNLKDFANVAKFYGAINLGNQLKFALEICGALVFLNAVDFLHRAIKSEYILITNDLKAKITYFCKSRLVSDKSGVLPINTGYVAPEIFSRNKRTFIDAQACVENLDEKYNFTCEVYCFGILLWELAHEKDPYQSGLEKIYNDSYLLKNFNKNLVPKEYSDITIKVTIWYQEDIIPGTPFNFSELYKNCWNKNPQNRPTTKELLTAIEKISEETIV